MASEGADPYRGLRREQKSEAGSWTGNTTARELEGEGDRSLPAPPLKARDSAAMGQLQGDAPERDRYFAQGARGEGGRWQRGSSGNPRGRPPNERALSAILRRLLREPAPGQEGMSAREALCLQLLTRALEGDMAAIRLVLEYTDGKPAQRVEGLMTVQMMPPFTSDEAVAAQARLAAWAGEDAETLGWGDGERLGSGGETYGSGVWDAETRRGGDAGIRRHGDGETRGEGDRETGRHEGAEDEGPRTLAG